MAEFTQEQIKAEMDANPGLNEDAALGNLMTRAEQASRQVSPAVPAAPAPSPATVPPAPTSAAAPAPQAQPEPEKALTPLPLGEQEYNETIKKYTDAGYAPDAARQRVDELFKDRPRDFQTNQPAAAAQPMQQHRILTGQNLSRIAQQYGLTVQELLAANPQITDPNMIYSGQSLNIPPAGPQKPFTVPEGYERISGAEFPTTELQRANFTNIQTDPTGTFLYGRRTDPAAAINDQAQTAYNILEGADKLADSTIRKSQKEEMIQSEIEAILGIDRGGNPTEDTVKASDGSVIDLTRDQSALSMYKQLLQSPEIQSLQKRAGDIQQKLDELDASEVALRNDIAKEVEGEAPQSYIDAKVAERMKDMYPRKLALQAELRNLVGQLQGEKENAANILQFTLQDENTRYNRMFDYLQFQAQQGQIDFSNKMQLFNAMKDLPPNRSITIGGVEYKGLNEDANLNVVQFTDENRNIVVAGIDKQTGEIKYSQIIGKAPAGSSGGSGTISLSKQYSEMVAGQNIDILTKVNQGVYGTLTDDKGTVVYDKEAYKQALTNWNTGSKALRNDSSVTVDGVTYTGKQSEQPSPYDYAVTPPADLK